MVLFDFLALLVAGGAAVLFRPIECGTLTFVGIALRSVMEIPIAIDQSARKGGE